MRKHLARVLPWLVTAAILAFLFSRIPISAVIEATRNSAPWFVPAIVLNLVAIYLADSYAIMKTFRWYVAPLGYRETLTLRGVTYLLALVNYTLGQGGLVYFVNRTRGVAVMRAAAAVLLVMGINLLLLLLFSTLGLALGAQSLPALRTIILVGYAGLAVYISLLLWRPAFLTKRPILDVLLEAGVAGHLKCLAVRLPHLVTLLLISYVSLHAFGVHVPLLEALLAIPVVLFVAVLPISFQGLGPSQGVMVFFFAPYAQGDATHRAAQVLAAGLGMQAVAWCVQIVIGLVCARSQLGRTLRREAKEISAKS
jgi:hypothetical protein